LVGIALQICAPPAPVIPLPPAEEGMNHSNNMGKAHYDAVDEKVMNRDN